MYLYNFFVAKYIWIYLKNKKIVNERIIAFQIYIKKVFDKECVHVTTDNLYNKYKCVRARFLLREKVVARSKGLPSLAGGGGS
jgi:hypothetical protein